MPGDAGHTVKESWQSRNCSPAWDEVSEGAVHVAKETQNGCWADIRI